MSRFIAQSFKMLRVGLGDAVRLLLLLTQSSTFAAV
jgi:hypothetical protein